MFKIAYYLQPLYSAVKLKNLFKNYTEGKEEKKKREERKINCIFLVFDKENQKRQNQVSPCHVVQVKDRKRKREKKQRAKAR